MDNNFFAKVENNIYIYIIYIIQIHLTLDGYGVGFDH